MSDLLKEGEGRFYIKAAITQKNGQLLKTSKGDPKVMLIIEIFDKDGKYATHYEHLTAKSWTKQDICEAVGRPDLYKSGSIEGLEQLDGMRGECIIKTSDDGSYGTRSVVDKYLKAVPTGFAMPSTVAPAPKKTDKVDLGDGEEIPF